MEKAIIALAVIALVAAAPTVAAVETTDDARNLNCTGTPTNIQAIDGVYQNTCNSVNSVCSLFDPCPI